MKLSHPIFLTLACASIAPVINASRPASPSLNAASSSTADHCPKLILLTEKQIVSTHLLKNSSNPILQDVLFQIFDIAKEIKKIDPSATDDELLDSVNNEIEEKVREEMIRRGKCDARIIQYCLPCWLSSKIRKKIRDCKEDLLNEQCTLVSNASRPASPSLNAASSSIANPCPKLILLTEKQIKSDRLLKNSFNPILQDALVQICDIAKEIKKLDPSATNEELRDYVNDEIKEKVTEEMIKHGKYDPLSMQDFRCKLFSKIWDETYAYYMKYQGNRLNEQCKIQ